MSILKKMLSQTSTVLSPSTNRKLPAIVLLILALSACSEQPKQAESSGMHPADVAVLMVNAKTVPFIIEIPATLSGAKEVEVRARISGILESRNFEEGQQVKAGQSLFSIESDTYEVEVLNAQAEVNANKARQAQAKNNLERLKPLRDKKTVSQQDLDDANSNLAITTADYEAALSKLKQAQLRLDYTNVVSPINGIVGIEGVSEGSYIEGPQQLLTQLTQVDPIRVHFGLSSREQLKMRKSAELGELTLPDSGHWKTKIKLQDGSIYEPVGEVNFNDIRVNPNTGTSEFQAIIPNKDMTLRPGQFVRVILEGAYRNNVHVVPQRAVLDNGTGKFVYLYGKNEQGITIAKFAPVEVAEWVQEEGPNGIENSWVINKGLNDGDQVIIDGMARIFFPGMPVKLVKDSIGTMDDNAAVLTQAKDKTAEKLVESPTDKTTNDNSAVKH